MQRLNDYIFNHAQSLLQTAYLLLSEQNSSDLGLTIGLNILDSAFGAVGGSLGPVGSFIASFVSGMVSYWATSTPPSLNTQFATLWDRLEQSSVEVDTQLATYATDVPGNWNVQFTYNGQSQTLSNLADITVPKELELGFETLANAALLGFEQQVWTTVMKANYVVTLWEPTNGVTPLPGDPNNPPVQWDEQFIAAHPAYYHTWTWHNSAGCGDTSGWVINEYNLGTGASTFSDGSMSSAACAHLFQDSAPGVIINPSGLFPRATAFTGLGIPQTTVYVPAGGGGAVGSKLSMSYLRAMKEGHTLGRLIETEGRENVQRRIIEKAQRDSVFAKNLAMRPRQTIEKFLNVLIPEVVSVSAIVETPRTFALVVPMKSDEQ
jgi:hypothetical protein